MEESNVTAAAVMSFTERLQDASSEFYTELAGRWPEHQEKFASFVRDCGRNKTQVIRTYQETISDALDATFSFKGLKLEEYVLDTHLPADSSYVDALRVAVVLEEKACTFYGIAAEHASLLATLPRAFTRAAKRRAKRKSRLDLLLTEATG